MTEKSDSIGCVNDEMLPKETEQETLLPSIAMLLKTERGSFYPDKNYGTQAFSTADYAFAFANQALHGIGGVYIKSVEQKQNVFEFTVIINDSEREVSVDRCV